MSQELSRMVKNAREENARRGGWVRIFPTAETWPNYGSMLEFSSPNNQILHEHLFPDAARKTSFRPPTLRNAERKPKDANKPVTTNPKMSSMELRKRSQSAGPGREKLLSDDKIKRDQESECGEEPESIGTVTETQSREFKSLAPKVCFF